MKNRKLLIASIFVLTFLGISYLGLADNLEQNQLIDSIKSLNERLIKVETMQNSYSNSIQFYSLLITVIIAAAIALSAYFVNNNNKNMLQVFKDKQTAFDNNVKVLENKQTHSESSLTEIKVLNSELKDKQAQLEISITKINNLNSGLVDKQIEFDSNLTEIKELNTELKRNQKILMLFVEDSEKEIKRIVSEQEYYHFEIFDYLSNYQFNDYIKRKDSKDLTGSIESLSNLFIYHLITLNILPKNRNIEKSIYLQNKEDYFKTLEEKIKENFNKNSSTTIDKAFKSNLINNLENSIKFVDSEDESTITKIQSLIEMVKSYKASDETEEKS